MDAPPGAWYTFFKENQRRCQTSLPLCAGLESGWFCGTDRVLVRWRSAREKNSVQFLFEDAGGAVRAMLELKRRDAWGEAVFPLGTTVAGPKDLSLIFLPGSSLDLESIRFLEAGEEKPDGHG